MVAQVIPARNVLFRTVPQSPMDRASMANLILVPFGLGKHPPPWFT